jgi:hypothetical protein
MSIVHPRVALLALCVSAWCLNAAPVRVLFPRNLHLTRQIEDPLSRKTVTIDEYCSGNRVVSISGDKTVIADYDRQEITEIDRRAGTYSISRFDEVATISAEPSADQALTATATPTAIAAKRDRWKATPRGVRSSAAGRSLEQFEFAEEGGSGRKVEVGIDRSVELTHDAVEVLIGAAYPNPRREEHEPLLRAAGVREPSRIAATSAEGTTGEAYGLPVTQAFTYSDSGAEVTFRTTVTRVGSEVPPAEMLIVPPAATRVESTAAAVRRQLREFDHPTSSKQRP